MVDVMGSGSCRRGPFSVCGRRLGDEAARGTEDTPGLEGGQSARISLHVNELATVQAPEGQEKSTWRFRQVLDLPTEFGRREWTRTIDPHHVKVVL
jgi:hypothetical protein